MGDPALVSRVLAPDRLLDIAMRRSLNRPQFRCFQKGEKVHPGIYYTDSVSPTWTVGTEPVVSPDCGCPQLVCERSPADFLAA